MTGTSNLVCSIQRVAGRCEATETPGEYHLPSCRLKAGFPAVGLNGFPPLSGTAFDGPTARSDALRGPWGKQEWYRGG